MSKSRLLFTRGRSTWSDTICEVLQEPVSHVSVFHKGWVYHSDLLGVRREKFADFRKRQKVIIMLDIDPIQDIEAKYEQYRRSWYDVGAGLFIGLSFLARRYLRIPLPKSNLWQSSGMFICTEWATISTSEVDSMITPHGLYRKLSGKN